MAEERKKKIEELEKINQLLNPQKFVKYKKELERKEKVLKVLETENIQKDIDKLKLNLQKIFLKWLTPPKATRITIIQMLRDFTVHHIFMMNFSGRQTGFTLQQVKKHILTRLQHTFRILTRNLAQTK
jgi:hypothetical protein